MYIINDIDLLKRLGRNKILDFLLTQCKVAISAIRLTDYSLSLKREVEQYPAVLLISADENFSSWSMTSDFNKSGNLSMGDISSIYIAKCNSGATLVISEEDLFLKDGAIKHNVPSIDFDEFIISTIKDERIIQLYNLIKVA